jgi:hypothetical protein
VKPQKNKATSSNEFFMVITFQNIFVFQSSPWNEAPSLLKFMVSAM